MVYESFSQVGRLPTIPYLIHSRWCSRSCYNWSRTGNLLRVGVVWPQVRVRHAEMSIFSLHLLTTKNTPRVPLGWVLYSASPKRNTERLPCNVSRLSCVLKFNVVWSAQRNLPWADLITTVFFFLLPRSSFQICSIHRRTRSDSRALHTWHVTSDKHLSNPSAGKDWNWQQISRRKNHIRIKCFPMLDCETSCL